MSEGMSYRDEIQETVADIVQRLPEWNADPYDSIHESADTYVIYTSRCIQILTESSNEDAAFDHMGSDALDGCGSFSEVMSRLAYYAVHQDLCEEYGRLSDWDKLEARDESLCADCEEVFSVSDLECDRKGREGSDICEGCHEQWMEDNGWEDEDEDDDNTDEGEE